MSLPALVFLFSVPFLQAELIRIQGDLPKGDEIILVKPECSYDISSPATVTVRADYDIQVIFHCKDQFTETLSSANNEGQYIASVYYSGDSSSFCLFYSIPNSNFYQVALEIAFLKEGALEFKDSYLVNCAYGDYAATNDSQTNLIGEPMVAPYETYKHIHRVHNHSTENITMSTFHIDVVDNMNEIILSKTIPLGKKIKLRVTMTAGTDRDQGFHVFNCEARPTNPDIETFSFIREGCGEGVILGRTEGFVTKGLTAESPYFEAFEIFGSKSITYMCHFYMCHEPCDGNSCIHSHLTSNRRRRDVTSVSTRRKLHVRHSVTRIKNNDASQLQVFTKSIDNKTAVTEDTDLDKNEILQKVESNDIKIISNDNLEIIQQFQPVDNRSMFGTDKSCMPKEITIDDVINQEMTSEFIVRFKMAVTILVIAAIVSVVSMGLSIIVL